MSIIGPRMKKEVGECLDFVIRNLKEQYVIPHYSSGYYEASNDYDYISSKLLVQITVKNLTAYSNSATNTEPDFSSSAIDNIGALDIIAKVAVEDDLENDNWGNDRADGAFLAFFGTNSSSYTETKEVEICDNNFEVSVTYTRSYSPISSETQ